MLRSFLRVNQHYSSKQYLRVKYAKTITRYASSHITEVPADQALRSDVKLLGKILGNAIKVDNEEVFAAVEKLRNLGREVQRLPHNLIVYKIIFYYYSVAL